MIFLFGWIEVALRKLIGVYSVLFRLEFTESMIGGGKVAVSRVGRLKRTAIFPSVRDISCIITA